MPGKWNSRRYFQTPCSTGARCTQCAPSSAAHTSSYPRDAGGVRHSWSAQRTCRRVQPDLAPSPMSQMVSGGPRSSSSTMAASSSRMDSAAWRAPSRAATSAAAATVTACFSEAARATMSLAFSTCRSCSACTAPRSAVTDCSNSVSTRSAVASSTRRAIDRVCQKYTTMEAPMAARTRPSSTLRDCMRSATRTSESCAMRRPACADAAVNVRASDSERALARPSRFDARLAVGFAMEL
mmetsp:Transcript_8248/g.28028  ORF Transcript_8248/g.28028 Transcript_8248/m.28028 type:complete len:239 (+) Transcript_8248:358-1074(+)